MSIVTSRNYLQWADDRAMYPATPDEPCDCEWCVDPGGPNPADPGPRRVPDRPPETSTTWLAKKVAAAQRRKR